MTNKYNPPIDPLKLRRHYKQSVAANPTKDGTHVWLTAHSHRWWPDAAQDGQAIALNLAYEEKDDKWGTVFGEIIPAFQKCVAARIGVNEKNAVLIAHDENTFNLVGRVLSCYFSHGKKKTTVVTTDGEFQSFGRLLNSLEGRMGFSAVRVPTHAHNDLTDRIVRAVKKNKPQIVYVSTVFFQDGYVLQDVQSIIEQTRKVGATVILDAYHHFNNRVLSIDKLGGDIFVVGGGYKGGGAGEGAAWMKIPENCKLEPIMTGWFADFDALSEKEYPSPVRYGADYNRFSGATRDVSGICRQLAVLEWMDKQGLDVPLLEKNNLYQMVYMISRFDELGCVDYGAELLTLRDKKTCGPFLAVRVADDERRASVADYMKKSHIHFDTRGDILRLGSGPYTTQDEMDKGVEAFADGLRAYSQRMQVAIDNQRELLEIL